MQNIKESKTVREREQERKGIERASEQRGGRERERKREKIERLWHSCSSYAELASRKEAFLAALISRRSAVSPPSSLFYSATVQPSFLSSHSFVFRFHKRYPTA
jgi:hypothetical protein